MPPKSAYGKNPRPAFKPPRPVNGSSSNSVSESSTKNQKKATAASSSASEPSSEEDAGGNADQRRNNTEAGINIQEEADDDMDIGDEPLIPPKLLSHLVDQHFQHDDTRITSEAMAVMRKYIELFTMEAVGRANEEKKEAALAGQGKDDDFIDVADLEKLAPQLLMDF